LTIFADGHGVRSGELAFELGIGLLRYHLSLMGAGGMDEYIIHGNIGMFTHGVRNQINE
jgi:hypothetical protein